MISHFCFCDGTGRCLRLVEAEAQHRTAMAMFGAACAADVDLPDLEAFLAGGPTREKMEEVAALCAVTEQLVQPDPLPWQKAPDLDRRLPGPPPRYKSHP